MIATPHRQGHWGAPGTTLGKFEHIAAPAAIALTDEDKAKQEQDRKLLPFKSAVRAEHGISGEAQILPQLLF